MMQITGIHVLRQAQMPAEVNPGQKLELEVGDTLRVSVSLEYQGKASSVTLYAAVGKKILGIFDETVHGEAKLTLPSTPTEYIVVEGKVDISLQDIPTGTYDLYCKLKEEPGAGMPELDDVIEVIGYNLIQQTKYPFYYIYDGDSEVAEFRCKTDPFSPAEWSAEGIASAIKAKVEEAGGMVLQLTVYADTSPVLWTNFKVEVVSTPLPSEGTAMATGVIPIWAGILIAAFALAFLIAVITWSIKSIAKTFQHEPISEEIKLTWSRETLMGAAQDFEIYLDRSPTPVDELEQMSDQHLRDYVDEMAEVIVPPGGGLSWLPWVAIGGVALVGVGAMVALSGRKK